MVTIEDIKKFKQVKEQFEVLPDADRVRILRAMRSERRVDGLTAQQQRGLLFRLLYDPRKTIELTQRVEAA